MPRRKRPKPEGPAPLTVGDPTISGGFCEAVRVYAEWMALKNYAPTTIVERQESLQGFVQWCEMRSVLRPADVTRPILERYLRYLFYYRSPRTGRPLAACSQAARIRALRGLFRYLTKAGHIGGNPASELEPPKVPKRLPKEVLTVAEVETVLSQPDMATGVGVRDRALLEVLYSTGMRRAELAGLGALDVDAERGTVWIRHGKGRKDRIVPIGARALDWVERYQWEVRPGWVVGQDDGPLFLTQAGEAFTLDHLTSVIRRYVERANLGKSGACHLFRHTMATLMLEGGADIRHIQAILGHEKLETTQLYTRVSIQHLKAIHDASHPAAQRKRTRRE